MFIWENEYITATKMLYCDFALPQVTTAKAEISTLRGKEEARYFGGFLNLHVKEGILIKEGNL